jgi:hypothetical protein
MIDLPPVNKSLNQTLQVVFIDGGEIKVPYSDKEAAISFLETQTDWVFYSVIGYTGV